MATVRYGYEYTKFVGATHSLEAEALREIRIELINYTEAENFAKKIGEYENIMQANSETFERKFDRTIGSILMGIDIKKKRYQELEHKKRKQKDEQANYALTVLKALKIMYFANVPHDEKRYSEEYLLYFAKKANTDINLSEKQLHETLEFLERDQYGLGFTP